MDVAEEKGSVSCAKVVSIAVSLLILMVGVWGVFYWDMGNELERAIKDGDNGNAEGYLMAAMILQSSWVKDEKYNISELHLKSARMGNKNAQFIVCSNNQEQPKAYILSSEEHEAWCKY